MATWAAADILAYARSKKGESRCDTCCASFVSEAFTAGTAAAHVAMPFGATASVPALVGEFDPTEVELLSATSKVPTKPADLIVFGDNAHVMIYSGNGNVCGTSGKAGSNGVLIPGSTTVVVDFPMASISPPATKVLHTNMDAGDTVIDPLGALGDAITTATSDLFGTMFGWIPAFAINAGILLLAAALVFVGIKQTLSSADV
jgi:hypothetical protein